ncbi:hypothetical protein [Candidatus Coxiella mudrowiae]|uniref:hypothetical protein n=1 Tax=Candidatus Coxiella mudrowiae TaxID=2054173 RepID=UPI001F2411C5|nr:hypothetical protein [Candidatus Coxiella mudrowiae]
MIAVTQEKQFRWRQLLPVAVDVLAKQQRSFFEKNSQSGIFFFILIKETGF